MNNKDIYYKDKNGNDTFGIYFQQYSIIIINTIFKRRVPLYHFMRLTGEVDLQKLEKSIQALYDTYDALRIRIFLKNENINISQFTDIGNFQNDCNYCQRVLLNYDYKLSVMQSKGENTEDKLAYAKSEFIEKITKYKSVIDTNLLDICVYNIGVDDYLLCFSVDHLASDGISVNMLIYSMFDYYKNGVLSNKPSKMFVEYVEQINSLYKTDKGIEKYQFYQNLIKDVVQLNIPSANDSDFDLNSNGELIKSFDKESIEKAAQINRTSVNNVVTLSLLLGIAKYFKNNDICIGSAFANRNSFENRNIIGLLATGFINRYVFNSTESYKDALKHLMNITGKKFQT